MKKLLPGFLLLVTVAVTAKFLSNTIPVLTPLVLVIVLGAITANIVQLPESVEAGRSKHPLLLETAIVLLGAKISVEALLTAGPLLVGLILAVVIFGLLLVEALSRSLALNARLGSLLAAGSSICGVSAIAATAPACNANETEVAHAAATILLFDAVTLAIFPVIGQILHLESQFYGIWIGLSMFSTGPVAAAGFAHSPIAGKWATMTKLARNALIGAVAMWYSFRYVGQNSSSIKQIWTDFPKFLLGFILLAVLTNSSVIPDAVVDSIAEISDALFLLAFAGLGFEIQLKGMRDAGIAPIGVVGTYLIIVGGLMYLLVGLLF